MAANGKPKAETDHAVIDRATSPIRITDNSDEQLSNRTLDAAEEADVEPMQSEDENIEMFDGAGDLKAVRDMMTGANRVMHASIN